MPKKSQKKFLAVFRQNCPLFSFRDWKRTAGFSLEKKGQKVFGKASGFSLLETREAARHLGKEERTWIPSRTGHPAGDAPDEELIDTPIAISVVAKRLAESLRTQLEKEKAFRCSPL